MLLQSGGRQSFCRVAVGLLLTGRLLLASDDPPRPNIILVMADDMGWGDPSSYSENVTLPDGSAHPDQGWIQTPVIDEMAASGIKFTRFYAASAVCSPTRASCLTGRNPFRVGIPFANDGRLGFDETPLSKVLSEVGYRCGHFGKWHLGSLTTLREDSNRGGDASVYSAPWHHSYDTCFVTESRVPTYHPYRITDNSAALPTSFEDPNFYNTRYWRVPESWNTIEGEGSAVPVGEVNDLENGDDSKLIIDQALPFIQNAVAEEEPFFLVIWFHTPHKPVVDPGGISGTDSSDALRDSIEDMDTALGRLRSELDNLGVRDQTMLWLTSDNGPENGDDSPNEISTSRSLRSGRYRGRKRSLYEGGLRVPGVLEWPEGVSSARVTDYPAVTSDYYPTILDYLQLSVPNQKPLDGISLRPLIEGTVSTRTQPIGFKINAHNSWVTHRYKLIDSGSGWELYDLLNIPEGEEVEETPLATAANVATKSTEIQAVYQELLEEFTAWDATLATDSPYLSPERPSVTLTTEEDDLTSFVDVSVTFSEPVTQLHGGEFSLEKAELINLSGAGANYILTVLPCGEGQVSISLPEGAAFDSEGNPNLAAEPLKLGEEEEPQTRAITLQVDIGHESQETAGVGWNNFSADTSESPTDIASLVDNSGESSGISLAFRKTGTTNIASPGANYDGPFPTGLAGLLASALRDGFFIQTNATITLSVDHLLPEFPVRLTLYGARGNNGSSLNVSLVGEETSNHTLTTVHLNSSEVLLVEEVYPSSTGELSLLLTSAGPNASALNYLSIETMVEVEEATDEEKTSSLDCDGDGQSNVAEYITGNDPRDAGSFFHASLESNNLSTVSLTWPGKSGRDYSVQWSTDLVSWLEAAALAGMEDQLSVELEKAAFFSPSEEGEIPPALYFRVAASLSTSL